MCYPTLWADVILSCNEFTAPLSLPPSLPPSTGVCFGLQMAVIEFARNVLGWKDAQSTEFDKTTTHPVVGHHKQLGSAGGLEPEVSTCTCTCTCMYVYTHALTFIFAYTYTCALYMYITFMLSINALYVYIICTCTCKI